MTLHFFISTNCLKMVHKTGSYRIWIQRPIDFSGSTHFLLKFRIPAFPELFNDRLLLILYLTLADLYVFLYVCDICCLRGV